MKLYIYRELKQNDHSIYVSITQTIESLQNKLCQEFSIPNYKAKFTYKNSDGAIIEVIHTKKTIKSSGLTESSSIYIEEMNGISDNGVIYNI